MKLVKYLAVFSILSLWACNPRLNYHTTSENTQENLNNVVDTIFQIDAETPPQFSYFANGHLSRENYPYKSVEKEGRIAGEIIRASDARLFSGMYAFCPKPIYISDGKRFAVDVFMDHIGTFTLKLEESLDGGPTTKITIKNTKINQWETLVFDFQNNILGGPTYPKIAIFVDLYAPVTGKDVYTYFSNIVQLSTPPDPEIVGNKEEAVKIVVLGSSTAAGTGPSESRNAWVNRYRRQLQAVNGHHQMINLAVGGYTTYHLLPSDHNSPIGKPQPDVYHNISKAISLAPDAVIINLPSNDASKGYSVKEQLDNYRVIKKLLDDNKIPVWVSTPQGRNMEKDKRTVQKMVRDSTYKMFERKTLDFWRNLAHWSGTVSKKYDCGDGIHLNDEGHRLLFEEVLSKDIPALINESRNGIIGKDHSYRTSIYKEGYVLKWQDEFNGTMLDTNVWSHELGDGCPSLCGWGNAEKVWYRPENSEVKNGKLIITAKKDHEHDGFWSASRIVTRDKVNFHFGRIDIRAKLPETQGLWPALWLLGENRADEGWPYCGEIDIMEEKGQDPYRVRGTLFYKATDGGTYHKGDKYELRYGNFSDDFHVYSIDWTEESIKYFVDDQLYTERKYSELAKLDHEDNPFLKPFYMLINCAVGGNYLGYPNEDSVFPQTFEIDYVRHYVKDKYHYCAKTEEKVEALPIKEKLWIYLMAGQSNMEGAGTVGPSDTIAHPRIFTMNKAGEWIYAKEPIHQHSNGNRGLDCGYSFANALINSVPDDVSIAIIPSAMGGSSINHWLTDEEYRGMRLWTNLQNKIKQTEKDGVFKGMIWHQGETDAKPDRLNEHESKLNEFFVKVRKEVNNPTMPVVMGELGKFQTHRPLWLKMNAIFHRMAKSDHLLEVIRTSDLQDKGDQVHFNAEGQRTMGVRYAQQMAKLQQLKEPKFITKHKLMTYNMRLDLDSDGNNKWDNRKELFVNQIDEINPDIFGIQEGLPHQINYLAGHLSKYDYVGTARDGEADEEEYCAIFYNSKRYEILESNTFWLSRTPNVVSKNWNSAYLRICTYARFKDNKSGSIFWVFNTHLDNESAEARKEGLRLINQKIDELNIADQPVVLMGDFNAEPNDDIIRGLSGQFVDGFQYSKTDNYRPIGTFNGFDLNTNSSRRIDYIFVSKDDLKVGCYEVDQRPIGGRFPSDHFPVIVDIKL